MFFSGYHRMLGWSWPGFTVWEHAASTAYGLITFKATTHYKLNKNGCTVNNPTCLKERILHSRFCSCSSWIPPSVMNQFMVCALIENCHCHVSFAVLSLGWAAALWQLSVSRLSDKTERSPSVQRNATASPPSTAIPNPLRHFWPSCSTSGISRLNGWWMNCLW